MKTVQDKFIVVRMSENTNSFGLYCIWLLNRKGQVITICTSKRPEIYAELTLSFQVNDQDEISKIPRSINGLTFGFELPEVKENCPLDVVAAFYKEREKTLKVV